MDNIDTLIQNIDNGIVVNKAMLTLISKDQEKHQELRTIKRNICYLEMFREIALEMKEEI